MKKFEIIFEDEVKVLKVVVFEEEVEGWIKGSLRGVWWWGVVLFFFKFKGFNVGNLEDD